MPATTREFIGGAWFRVTRDDAGHVVSQAADADPIPATPRPLIAKARAILATTPPLSQPDRDHALQLILAMLLDLTDG